MKQSCDLCTGIDPLWINQEPETVDGIRVIGATVEDVDLAASLSCPPDLIVCRHTLEHIWDPLDVLLRLFNIATKDTLFLFEVPSLVLLLERYRIDQIFHQHLQYFSLHSFCKLINQASAEYLSHSVNFHNWGAMIVAFKKGEPTAVDENSSIGSVCTKSDIEVTHEAFNQQMLATQRTLDSLAGSRIYGYGAAQMLPVLAYHIGSDLSMLTCILDDDTSKVGMRYKNLPLKIRSSETVIDLENASVLITAVDNVNPIMKKLLLKQPKRILVPLNVI